MEAVEEGKGGEGDGARVSLFSEPESLAKTDSTFSLGRQV